MMPFNGLPFRQSHERPRGGECRGQVSIVDLGHDFITDVLEIVLDTRRPMARADWWSIGYAIAEGAASALSIRRDDLDIAVRLSAQSSYAVFLTDAVPGGAGHVARVHEHFPLVMRKSLERVDTCSCEETTSCYQCLRTYTNQRMHAKLSRGAAATFLRVALQASSTTRSTSPTGLAADDPLSLIAGPDLAEALRQFVPAKLPMPEVGFELVDDSGAVAAEFEVAWPGQMVAIVMGERDSFAPPGWQVLRSDQFLANPMSLVGAFAAPQSDAAQ
jgi:hypothetical protein